MAKFQKPKLKPKKSNVAKAKTTARKTSGKNTNKKTASNKQIIFATIFGAIFTIPFLFIFTALYSFFCYAIGKVGDASVIAPTLIYMLSIFSGSFLASTLVRQRSYVPAAIIGTIYFVASLIITFGNFEADQIKYATIPIKLLITMAAAGGGFAAAYIPFEIYRKRKAKQKRQQREEESKKFKDLTVE